MVRKGLIITLLLFLFQASLYAALPGDANNDGTVNGLDYIVWLKHFGTVATGPSEGDFNADGRVNGQDYISWLNNYGATVLTSGGDPTPPILSNLLTNPGFESGSISPWSGGASSITTQVKHSGNNAMKVTGWDEQSTNVNVTAGKTYTFTGWFLYAGPLGDGYGQTRFEADKHTLTNYHENMVANQWYKIAVTFTAGSSNVALRFGLWGPKSTAVLYYDDLMLFEHASNIAPVINPQANVLSGQAPLTVQFTANEQDYDGAVTSLRWNFGDGGEDILTKTNHTFIAAGTYQTSLTAVDNNGASSTKKISITVSDSTNPTVSITSPVANGTYTTSNASVTLSGISTSPNGQINKIVWDNVTSDDAGVVSITPAASVNWSATSLPLKPGKNELLITTTSTSGTTATSRIIVTRQISNPTIKNISANTQTPKTYEKYELTFDVDTVAEQYMFMYDPSPPAGASIYSGVTVEGIITKPDGSTATHPAFYMSDVTTSGNNYIDTGMRHWKLRISPQQTGTHQVVLRVTDKSGTFTSPAQSFSAQPPSSEGFVKVSTADPRYFQYSSGKIYWPLGMTWGGGKGPTSDGIDLSNSVLNYDRYWMGGDGAYTTRWPRWFSTAKPEWGNEGAEINAFFTEHYPGHELSQRVEAGKGYRIWIGWLGAAKTMLKPSTTYQVKVRIKTVGITGPANSSTQWGLVVKHHQYWSIHDQPTSSMLSQASMIPPVTGTHDWFTIINRYTTPSSTSDADFSIFLQNVTGGVASIDELSIRQVNGDGSLGGELVASSLADQHTYVDQRPMKVFDDEVAAGEKNDVHVRFVVHDKNDWIQTHLSSTTGLFVQVGDGYYQSENTKATWLLKQWWRYLVARLGYSTGLFGLELNNEGPPDNGTGTHAAMTAVFTRWVHNLDMHPHLNSTSFWCCWEPKFWGDKTKFPFLDFGDIHHYSNNNDMVAAHLEDALPVQTDNIKRPVVMGERGLVGADNLVVQQLKSTNKGTWYHDMLWSQLHSSSLYEIGYWYPEHVVGFSREAFTVPFANFVSTLDVDKGGYVDIAANSGNGSLQVFGQKNLSKNSAYAWIRNSNHTWKNVEANASISPISSNVTIPMNASRSYTITWYDTYNGQTIKTETKQSDGSGNLSLTVSNLTTDVAVKIN